MTEEPEVVVVAAATATATATVKKQGGKGTNYQFEHTRDDGICSPASCMFALLWYHLTSHILRRKRSEVRALSSLGD